jgi:hypothetical protein
VRELLFENRDHVLALLILLARIGDITTTFLVSPRLTLEANPIARRLGWRVGFASLLLCLVPYYSVAVSLVVLVPSLLVSAGNASRAWFSRAIGEERNKELILEAVSRSRPRHALVGVIASAGFMATTGTVLVWFYPSPDEWAYYFGLGICTYAAVIAIYGSLWVRKVFAEGSAGPARGDAT